MMIITFGSVIIYTYISGEESLAGLSGLELLRRLSAAAAPKGARRRRPLYNRIYYRTYNGYNIIEYITVYR